MYLFEARIIDEETGEVFTRVFSYSNEGLEEEMGKSKWIEKAIEAEKRNEEEMEMREREMEARGRKEPPEELSPEELSTEEEMPY